MKYNSKKEFDKANIFGQGVPNDAFRRYARSIPDARLMVAAYDENGVPCVMNAAWGTICGMDKIALIINEAHKTTKNIRISKAFTVALADKAHMAEADFFGIATGNKMPDKFEKSGCHAEKSKSVNAPVITEFHVTMECELAEIVETDHLHAVVGTIKNVCADEEVIGEKGKINPEKLNANFAFKIFFSDLCRTNIWYGVNKNYGVYFIRKGEKNLLLFF